MNLNQKLNMNIESGAFDSLRDDFNKILKRTLANMEKKESDAAEITLKLKINLLRRTIPDYTGSQPAEREALQPKIEHKIGSVMQIKDEECGFLKGEYELVLDDSIGDYVIRPIDDGQIDLFTERDCRGNIVYYGADEEKEAEIQESGAILLGNGEETSETIVGRLKKKYGKDEEQNG